MRTPKVAPLVLAAALSLVAMQANAQEASEADIAQARQTAEQASAAFNAGNYAESERLWNAATRLYPKAPTLALGLARAAAKNGHVVLAQEQYNKIIREWGNAASPPPAFKDALDAAQREVGDVSKRVADVTINLAGGAPTPTVTVDGAPVPPAALGLKRPVDPGSHTVHAEAQGYKSADQPFQVAEGGSVTASLTLVKDPDAVVAGPGPTPTPGGEQPPPAGSGGSSNKTLALAAFGVGGVGIVVGAITGIIAIGKHSDLKTACTAGSDGKSCPPDQQSSVDSYKTMGTISTIGFIVGGVGVAAGAVLWFTAPKEAARGGSPSWATIKPGGAKSGVEMTPYVGAGAAGVTGRF
jgi:hypothetical protein